MSNDEERTGGEADAEVHADQPAGSAQSTADERDTSRRRVLGYLALLGLGASGAAAAWHTSRQTDPQDSAPVVASTTTQSTEQTPDESGPPEIVARFAPDLYFGRLEKWFPTDPREYTSGSSAVVDGFDALDQYTAEFERTGEPPAPTVFYNVTEATPGVDAIQYWMYSVFDQFTVNFHWHDWELLQVFVDRDTGHPLLLAASAHSRKVPNNEFFDPVLPDGRRPGILAEVGSHSSASELNGRVPSFERDVVDDVDPDVTNDFVGITPRLSSRLAYGLPRDEGARLPFVMPTLDGKRLDEHPGLAVDRTAFVDESVTVASWHGIPTPPTSIPLREPGIVMGHPDSTAAIDTPYELEHISAVRAEIESFDGPRLSFEFRIPGFVEDRFADHITSVGIPWQQDRFTDPLADVTDPAHRQRIDGASPDGLQNLVLGSVRVLQSGASGILERVNEDARDALAGAISVSYSSLPVEVAVQLASPDPVASITRSGVFGFLHTEPGEHRLVVNGPGYAPVAERFVHDGGLVRAGARGDLTVVASKDAGWIRGDARDTTGISHVRIVEEYAGITYDAEPPETDRFAIAVHRDGLYTLEITDRNGRLGAVRVTPGDFDDEGNVNLGDVETGKLSLVRTLRDHLVDLRDHASRLAERDDARGGVLENIDVAIEEGGAALSASRRGNADSANERLAGVVAALEDAIDRLLDDRQDGYSDSAVAALGPMLLEVVGRAEEAVETELAG